MKEEWLSISALPTSAWIQAGCHLLRGSHIPPDESRKVGIEVEFDHGSVDLTPLFQDETLNLNVEVSRRMRKVV